MISNECGEKRLLPDLMENGGNETGTGTLSLMQETVWAAVELDKKSYGERTDKQKETIKRMQGGTL